MRHRYSLHLDAPIRLTRGHPRDVHVYMFFGLLIGLFVCWQVPQYMHVHVCMFDELFIGLFVGLQVRRYMRV